MKNLRLFHITCLLLAVITALLPLAACRGGETLNYPHDEILLRPPGRR